MRYKFIQNGLLKNLPNTTDLLVDYSSGKHTMLVLDSNVCLDIVQFMTKGGLAQDRVKMVKHLLKYTVETDIDINAGFGVFELACDKESLKINNQKFRSFSNLINNAYKLNEYQIDTQDFVVLFNQFENSYDSTADVLEPVLLYSYCALLKILELANRGVSKKESVPNLLEYLKWMDEELDHFLGFEFELAMSVLGGSGEYHRMVGYRRKDHIKYIRSTVWDLYNFRVGCLYGSLIKTQGRSNNPIYVTYDLKLASLLSDFKMEIMILKNRDIIAPLYSNEHDMPHYVKSFREIHNEIVKVYQKRIPSKLLDSSNLKPVNELRNLAFELEKKVA